MNDTPPLRLENLHEDQRLNGIVPDMGVTVQRIEPINTTQARITYRDDLGATGQHLLTIADLTAGRVTLDTEKPPHFTSTAADFRLTAEALRIKHAAAYDPLVAVNSSDVQPLPHQIRAVYEELLPRVPLRFLLADDPGAGKTIMAGLYLKELILRSDCERAIIVAPGGLVEQWQEELAQKFDLHFQVFTPAILAENPGVNPFQIHPYLIVRMDQIARNDNLMTLLGEVTWDVAVVDEAHRMAARYSIWAGEVDETKRFKLGRLLSETAHNFLLMTATPHAGKEEDFQTFMSLLDRDRFEGQYREGVHRTDTNGLMRRMVKEDLLTADGKPLFPERRAYTVSYELSPAEQDLYESVSEYVRQEMGRAERIAQAGEGRRGNNIGFALMVLQRRLASSPEAILRSLERRQAKLQARVAEGAVEYSEKLDFSSLEDFSDDKNAAEQAKFEARMEHVVDSATAAQTIGELEHEIAALSQLIEVARGVRAQDEDTKWVQLRTILDDEVLAFDSTGRPRKIIIFTEHKDTLHYLEQKITTQFGRAEAVLTIHGGTPREQRKAIREKFTHNPESIVLLATDAAGEGLNLQRAHLMVNYDLPWNPNRIEQRFGRIHRIGQRDVCHLWNLVATNTREGTVFTRLLDKIANMSKAYNGNLFNVLGETDAFAERSLKELLIDAIRYGDQPEVQTRLSSVIDASVSAGLDETLKTKALHSGLTECSSKELRDVRTRMENARERKLQPGYIASFFLPALHRLGGVTRQREHGRYELIHIPTCIRAAAPHSHLPHRYERITFETQFVQVAGRVDAELIAPGHPLLQAVLELIITDLGCALREGAVLVDRSSAQGDTPVLLGLVEQSIASGGGQEGPDVQVLVRYFDYVVMGESVGGGAVQGGEVVDVPLYLNYDEPTAAESERLPEILNPWVRHGHDARLLFWAYREGLVPRLEALQPQRAAEIERTRKQVADRLKAEINHWDREYTRLFALERDGVIGRIHAADALAKSEELETRLATRMRELDAALTIGPGPHAVRGLALVIPSHLLEPQPVESSVDTFALDTKTVERRAVEAALAAERSLGRMPIEMAHNNSGYDIKSTDANGDVYYLEVKGRISGAKEFTITASEVSFAKNQKDRHRLVLVEVNPDRPEHDELRYIVNAFEYQQVSVTTRSYTEGWYDHWSKGGLPT